MRPPATAKHFREPVNGQIKTVMNGIGIYRTDTIRKIDLSRGLLWELMECIGK